MGYFRSKYIDKGGNDKHCRYPFTCGAESHDCVITTYANDFLGHQYFQAFHLPLEITCLRIRLKIAETNLIFPTAAAVEIQKLWAGKWITMCCTKLRAILIDGNHDTFLVSISTTTI